MGLAAEWRAAVRRGARGVQARQPDPGVALHVIGVDDAAETGDKEKRTGGGDAERQCDDRGERGSDSGKWERVHGGQCVDCWRP